MAETANNAGASRAANEAQEAMKKQIAELRREITKIGPFPTAPRRQRVGTTAPPNGPRAQPGNCVARRTP